MIEKLIREPVACDIFCDDSIDTIDVINKINEIIDVLNKLLGCGQEVTTPGFEPDSLGSIPSVPASGDNNK